LGRLVDKSLVVAIDGTDARFSLLQTLRQYGSECLEQSGESDLVRSRHAAHYLFMAEAAHEGLRGASGPEWQERLTSQLGNLRAALDWFISTGNAEAALALTTGMAWLWFWNTEFSEGARWLGDALDSSGPRERDAEAVAHAWHGFLVCMAASPVAGAVECGAAAGAVETSTDTTRRAETLLLHATVLMRTHEFERSLDVLAQARPLIERLDHPWMLGTVDMLTAFSLVPLGRLEEAERAARYSFERFDAIGEVMFSIDSSNMLAGIAEGRGDLDGAAAIHEATLERCRAAGRRSYVAFGLVRLAALRARQGRDDDADTLYEEAIAHSFNPWHCAEAMLGQAAVARRRGDLPRARRLLEAADEQYGAAGLVAGRAAVRAGMTWWLLAAMQFDEAVEVATDAVAGASAAGDPTVRLVAETAFAAAKAVADPTGANLDAFAALARRRSGPGSALAGLTDVPDLTALARRLAVPQI
jgi:tetratricopeptide (TPR) repeat protein